MNTYKFRGRLYYQAHFADGKMVIPIDTILTFLAPSKPIALAILQNYGIGDASNRTVQRVYEGQEDARLEKDK